VDEGFLEFLLRGGLDQGIRRECKKLCDGKLAYGEVIWSLWL
jgi:hypothetical protein